MSVPWRSLPWAPRRNRSRSRGPHRLGCTPPAWRPTPSRCPRAATRAPAVEERPGDRPPRNGGTPGPECAGGAGHRARASRRGLGPSSCIGSGPARGTFTGPAAHRGLTSCPWKSAEAARIRRGGQPGRSTAARGRPGGTVTSVRAVHVGAGQATQRGRPVPHVPARAAHRVRRVRHLGREAAEGARLYSSLRLCNRSRACSTRVRSTSAVTACRPPRVSLYAHGPGMSARGTICSYNSRK